MQYKKFIFTVVVGIIIMGLALPVYSQKKGDACNPKQISECCKNIQKSVAQIEILRAKLQKLEAELQLGKTIRVNQKSSLEGTLKKINELYQTTEGGLEY